MEGIIIPVYDAFPLTPQKQNPPQKRWRVYEHGGIEKIVWAISNSEGFARFSKIK